MDQVKYCKSEVLTEVFIDTRGWGKMLILAAFQSKKTVVFILRTKTTVFLDTERNTQHLIRANLRWFLFPFSLHVYKCSWRHSVWIGWPAGCWCRKR